MIKLCTIKRFCSSAALFLYSEKNPMESTLKLAKSSICVAIGLNFVYQSSIVACSLKC